MARSENKLIRAVTCLSLGKKRAIWLRIRIFLMVVPIVFLLQIMPASVVTFLSSRDGLDSGVTLGTLNLNPADAVRKFLLHFRDILGMPRLLEQLVFKEKSVDDLGMIHIRLRQVFRGVPVYGAEVIVPNGNRPFQLQVPALDHLLLPGIRL